MNSLKKNIISSAIEIITEACVKYDKAVTKPYSNVLHIMDKLNEVQVPSDIEVYRFYKNDWDIDESDNIIMLTLKGKHSKAKKNNKESGLFIEKQVIDV